MSVPSEQHEGYAGLHVVAFESRYANSMERLISNHGGIPLVAPAMREIPLEENTAALDFAGELLAGEIDMVIFLTGVGTRTLAHVIETKYTREQLVEALSRVTTVARGPKPAAALRELGVHVDLLVPEPNTWRELLSALDERETDFKLDGCRVAIQEYGAPNPELIDGLQARGAVVRGVPVYQWAFPTDTAPLQRAIQAIIAGEVAVALFTTSMQVRHLMQLAAEMGLNEAVYQAMRRMVIASIGPTTSQTLKEEYGLESDVESSHPKMAVLVKEAAARSREILASKRKQAL